MNTTRPLLAAFAALALIGLSPAGAHAQPAPPPNARMQQRGPGPGIEHRVDGMLQRLNATADQTAKVHAIMEAVKTDITPMRATLRDSRKQMRTLLTAPQIDAAAIETLRAQDSTTRDQISRRVTAGIVEAANVLTPEQRAKLATMGPWMGPRMGPRMGPGRGPNQPR